MFPGVIITKVRDVLVSLEGSYLYFVVTERSHVAASYSHEPLDDGNVVLGGFWT